MDAVTAEKLANESGNNFQCRVAAYFRDRQWAVALSPYYVDPSTDKPREADLIVEHTFPVPQVWNTNAPQSIRLRLFIECKYVTQGTVFWFDHLDHARAREWIHTNTCIIPDHIYTNHHHYLSLGGRVAKLFATEKAKGDDNDPVFKAVNQCLSGFIGNRTRPPRISLRTDHEIIHQLNYPLVMCSSFDDFFYRVDVTPTATPEPLQSHFALEVDYAYPSTSRGLVREYFLVDVVAFDQIDKFIGLLEAEVNAAIFMVQDH